MKALALLGLGAALVAACDTTPDLPPLGEMKLTVKPTAAAVTTVDGWAVAVTRLLVGIPSVAVAASDTTLADSATAQLFDLSAATAQPLLDSRNRVARAWEDVSFAIGPVTAETAAVAPATVADRDRLVAAGASVWVEGTLTKAAVTKRFAWGLTTATSYGACAGPIGGVIRPGLVVPADGVDAAEVTVSADVLFRDAPADGALRGDALAAADADGDGAITLAELGAATLANARASGGAYATTATSGETLASFVGEQARGLVTAFRGTGGCTATP